MKIEQHRENTLFFVTRTVNFWSPHALRRARVFPVYGVSTLPRRRRRRKIHGENILKWRERGDDSEAKRDSM
jgi:hypothetical protein